VLGHPWSGEHYNALKRNVSTDYFKVLQVRLIRGRWLTEADDQSRPKVVLINQALATQFFPGEDPIGKTLGDTDLSPHSLRQIAGVVADIREGGLNEEIQPAMYYPFYQDPEGVSFLAVRSGQDAASMLPALASAIQKVDPNIGVRNEFTMTQRINNAAFLNRSSAWLVGGFAAVALLLGVIGLYGVVAYSVSRRTREIGIRMALGAQPGAVYRLILGEAGFVATVGIVIGLGCSIAAADLLRGLLFGVDAWDVPTLSTVAVLLGVCALAGSYLPARKAASVNPVEALRAE
jgi:predicted permease